MRPKIQIFFSYTRKDKEEALRLYGELEKRGFKAWIDVKDIYPGQKWLNAIRRAINDSDFFLVCLSRNSLNRRGMIQREILEALDIQKGLLEEDIYIIPVRLEDCPVPERLQEFQYVDIYKEDGLYKLLQTLGNRVLTNYRNFFEQIEVDEKKHMVTKYDPFELTFDKFLNLTQEQKDNVVRTASEINFDFTDHYFCDHSEIDWIVIAKKPGNIVKEGIRGEEPHEVDLGALASEINAVTHIYSRTKQRPVGGRNFGTAWSRKGVVDFYPTVGLEFDSPDGKQLVRAHFDTGNGDSFLSHEELLRRGIIQQKTWPLISGYLWGIEYRYYVEQLKCNLVGKSGKREIILNCQLVKDWKESGLMYSKNITGIVGRNLLLDNKISVLLHGENGETDIVRC